ncbi:hypothetical protein IWQ55_002117 [Labrenzia sp. EL_208]|nr:hypothetical protein [Labrenzia sp. EL_132]MBG6228908.1 hypothetical protein [Labrenzia sp. EL_208]
MLSGLVVWQTKISSGPELRKRALEAHFEFSIYAAVPFGTGLKIFRMIL